jgi:uncharacterized delta-60 repeat protein
MRPAPLLLGFLLAFPTALPLAAQQDGELDSGWGTDGIAQVDELSAFPPRDVACGPDGQCYVAYGSTGGNFGVAQLLPYGSFFLLGSAAFDLGGINSDMPTSITVGADGKPVLAGSATDATAEVQAAVARFSAGLSTGLDSGFSGDGKANQDFVGTALMMAVAVGPSGETVLGGCYAAGGSAGLDFAVVRYLANGAPDNGFDGNAVRTINFGLNSTGPSDDCIAALAIQPDGKIVAAGYARFSADDYDFALARFNVDGSLDGTFSPGAPAGMATVPFDLGGPDSDKAFGVALDRFGRILVSGHANASPALARLTSVGALDSTFDSDGKFHHPSATGTALDVVALSWPSERILYLSDGGDFTAVTEEGDLETGFGLSGSVPFEHPLATSTSAPVALTLSGGEPVLVGTATFADGTDYIVARYWMDQVFGDDFESGNFRAWGRW